MVTITSSVMLIAVIAAVITALTLLMVIFKLGSTRKILRYQVAIDVGTTMLMLWMFSGSTLGMLIGILAGFTVTLILWAMKAMYDLADRADFDFNRI